MFDLEKSVRAWSDGLRARKAFRDEDIVELESHLREEIDGLAKLGLSGEEAFLVAEHRIGRPEALAAEYAKVHGEPWRGMAFDTLTDADRGRLRRELILVACLALAAALLAQVPRLLGSHISDTVWRVTLLKNLGLFFMPLAAVYYAVRSRPKPLQLAVAAALFVCAGLLINLYPWTGPDPQTLILASLHLPVMLWLVVGLVFTAGRWREAAARMDFLRATGEAFIYGTLILCGGVVLAGFTIAIFSAVGLDIRQSYLETIGLGGLVAAPVVAVFLVNAKKSIVENIAPVLSRIFTPLFLVTMVAFIVVLAVQRRSPISDRDTLFAINAMLILVLALVIYNLTARRSAERREWTDWLNLALIACAAAVDAVALVSIVSRTLSFGWSPNRAALLGLNVVLLADLAGLAVGTLRFLAGRGTFAAIERWQAGYLPVLFGWCAVVVAVFPPLFAFA